MDKDIQSTDAEVQQLSETDDAQNASQKTFSVNRRGFMGTSAATLMGMALTKMSSESAEAQNKTTNVKLQRGTMLLLPAVQCAQLAPTFLRDQCVSLLFQHFTSQGMEFIPERALCCIYEEEGGAVGLPPADPSLILIWPTFRSFEASSPAHEAASIIAVRHCDMIGGAMASHVVVKHNPFQLAQFSQMECNMADGSVRVSKASREQMQSMTPDELAKLLGPPPVDPATAHILPSLSRQDMMHLATGAYMELLNDKYARPLYPISGLNSLMRDTPLVEKWSETQRVRYGQVFAGIAICCSTSSNACTSTSSTFTLSL